MKGREGRLRGVRQQRSELNKGGIMWIWLILIWRRLKKVEKCLLTASLISSLSTNLLPSTTIDLTLLLALLPLATLWKNLVFLSPPFTIGPLISVATLLLPNACSPKVEPCKSFLSVIPPLNLFPLANSNFLVPLEQLPFFPWLGPY